MVKKTMPDYFTHCIAAECIYGGLKENYRRQIAAKKTEYLLGAQGGDVFFFYGMSYKNNVGRMLHHADACKLFEQLSKGDTAYCAGWATHYALDCTVHPFVYAYEGAHRGLLLHQRYERDLGLYVSRKRGVRRTIMPREKMLACTFTVCDTVKKAVPYISAAGTARCLERYYFYTRRLFKSKKLEFSLDCDYSQPYRAFERSIELGIRAVECVLDGDIDPEVFNKSFLQK